MTKQQLKSYRDINIEIATLQGEYDRWRSIAERVNSSCSPTSRGGNKADGIATAVDHIFALMEELNAKIDIAICMRDQISVAIDQLEDPRYRILLRLYYLRGLTWDLVASEMHYDVRWVRKLHGKALQAIKPF